MMLSRKQNLEEEWQDMRLLRLFYARLAREFSLESPDCDELQTSIDVPSQEDFELARQWFKAMDERVEVHQLRQFLQTTTGVNEETLTALLKHHLRRAEHPESDRDKVDFMLVQFLAQTSPSLVDDSAVTPAFVAEGLKPVLGDVSPDVPDWLSPLNELVAKAQSCQSLNGLFSSGVLEKGRKIKAASGPNYFAPEAMVGFTQFNFLLRRIFFRLMHEDINAILDGLRELEAQGVATIDCRAAQFTEQESITQLRAICQSWKMMFQAEYSSGQPMRMLADLRAVIDAALQETRKKSAPAPRAKAAVASAAPAAHDAPEFEVSSGPPGDFSQDS
jgi:hypothetical protein